MKRTQYLLITAGILALANGGFSGSSVQAAYDWEYMTEINDREDSYWAVSSNGDKISKDTTVIMNGGTVTNKAMAVGSDFADVASGGHFIMNRGTANSIFGGYTPSGSQIYDNKVTINGGTVQKNVAGGYGDADVYNNQVEINGGNLKGTYIAGGYGAESGNAYKNKVIIADGILKDVQVYGGQTIGWWPSSAENNQIIIKGGIISGEVVAGDGGIRGDAKNNSIEVQNNVNLDNVILKGVPSEGKENTGNKLIINGWEGSAKQIANFNEVEFENLSWNNGKTILSSDDISFLSESSGGTTVKVNSFAGGQNFKAGEEMHLISSSDEITGLLKNSGEEVAGDVTATAGLAQQLSMNYYMTEDNKNVNLKITEVKAQEQTKVITSGSTGGMALLNQGMDLASNLHWGNTYGTEVFAVSSGSKSRYDTNNDLKIYGWTEVLGVGNKSKHSNGDFAWAVFYEHGNGSYATQTDVLGRDVRGDGDLEYNGGGLMGRYDWNNGIYAEASFHAGTLSNELKNGLMDSNEKLYDYDTDSSYWAAHVDIGRIFRQNDKDTFDVYAKYFYSHIGDDSFKIGADQFEVDEVTSSRIRAGVRFNDYKTDKSTWYYGAAYDYEFDGESTGKAQGLDIRSSSLKGGTVIGEAGYVYNPNEKWTIDSTLFGFAGQRDGFGGQVNVTYHF